MKITFLGDSVRQQYVRRLTETLEGDFEIWHPKENCRFSKYTLRGIFDWAPHMEGSQIVHWNNGLWDICDLFGDGPFTSETEYVQTMLRIADILQKKFPVVIFATTTPVRPENQYNRNETIDRYNALIVPKLQQRGVLINDLHSLVKQDVYRYICEDTIHLSEEGIELCAGQVARVVKETAKALDGAKTEDPQQPEDSERKPGLPVLL